MALDAVLAAADKNLDASLERLFALMRIESVSTDLAFSKNVRAAADWLQRELTTLGLEASVRETKGHPMVLAHGRKGGAGPRVLFYGHYDVQPADPAELWKTPAFEPRLVTLPNGTTQIVGRGSADDKGQLMTFVEALRAFLDAEGKLPLPVTILLEGEEETGSPSLGPFLEANKKELAADVALVCDTDMWNETTPAITTMLRGLLLEEVIIRGADRDLHSGLFGGAAINPIRVLGKIIAAVHDDQGRIAVPGFYEGVDELDQGVRAQWQALDFDQKKFLGEMGLGLPAGESGRHVLEQIWSRPTCDINGIIGGYTGQGSKTVIPAQASAKFSFRLVGRQDPAKLREAFRKFVTALVPADCKVEFLSHGGSPALQLPLDSPYLKKASAALGEEWGKPAVLKGSGGSIPIVGSFKRDLGMDSLLIGFGLDDDRIHSPNEKYNLSSFHKGTRSWVRILDKLRS
ncbi:MAG: M20/M25/M40 family metallo-hydrolase [Xanthobacteraceae bacterium]|nr:M20/M25/M40 family metallo-hydrolase [Xanthobacteraceae bacterium]QYK45775.1 MAG: M20/M25/M40 family metallo-hydrolase [Xanthobacteraceae bacterium]